ncbi:MAG: hypothetical protein K0S65_5068, partial [Labilithrix sp.]|nr:hypothetical protein [Labilithrix sp.]
MGKRSRLLGLVAFGLLGCSSLANAGCAATEPDGDRSGENGGGLDGDAPPPKPEQPGCAQDQYTEALPTNASLSGLTFSEANANDFLIEALEKRFPLGKAIVEGGLASSIAKTEGSCIDRFLPDKSSADAV